MEIDALGGERAAGGQRQGGGSSQRCQSMLVIHLVVPPKMF
jgi:hypothetical protein